MSLVDRLGGWARRAWSALNTDGDGVGAYGCRDCGERLSARGIEGTDPACPRCGRPMEFERDPPSSRCC